MFFKLQMMEQEKQGRLGNLHDMSVLELEALLTRQKTFYDNKWVGSVSNYVTVKSNENHFCANSLAPWRCIVT